MKIQKQTLSILLYILVLQLQPVTATNRFTSPVEPLLVVLLMVKDEADVIAPTLETYIQKSILAGAPDNERVAYVIYDTGSSDGTQVKAKEFFERNNIRNFVIAEGAFIDYSTSRNVALEYTEKKFPQATFILFPDAEWYLTDFDGLLEYCEVHKCDDSISCSCYNLDIIDPYPYSFTTTRLLRNESHVRFYRRVHELPRAFPCAKLPENIHFKYEPKKWGIEKSKKRWLRDIKWLLEDYGDNPKDKRTVFLIAQTYTCLGEWENARKFYHLVTEFGDKDEFNYLAYYNLGEITEYIHRESGKTSAQDWYESYHYYMKAYELRPHRAEPLVKIATHYYHTQEMASGYIFASRACAMSYPSQDTLFIEKGLYDYDRHRMLGITAWYVGDYEAGENAIRRALAARPGDSAIKYDLSCYECRKKS